MASFTAQNKPSLLRETIKKRIKNWMEETSTHGHGLPNIARNENSVIRSIWIICFCLSSGVCSFLVIRSINSYLEYGVFSKYDVIYGVPSVFPTVTVCCQNMFVTEEAMDYVKSIMEKYDVTFESFVNETNMKFYKKPGPNLVASRSNAKYLGIMNLGNESYSDSYKKSLGLSYDQFIISCFFAYDVCSDGDFEWYFDASYGNYYRFGKKTLKYTNRVGSTDGLIMQLAVRLGIPESNYTLSMTGGAHIFICNQTITSSSSEGFGVSPGTSTSQSKLEQQVAKALQRLI